VIVGLGVERPTPYQTLNSKMPVEVGQRQVLDPARFLEKRRWKRGIPDARPLPLSYETRTCRKVICVAA
jgi:hypothetical protein